MTTLYWTKEEIDTAKKSMSSYAFRQEFMASFEAKGSEMFKEDWVTFADKKPEHYDCYISVDLAGFQDVSKKKSKNTRLDNTAIAVVFVNEDGWYVENIIYGRWTLGRYSTEDLPSRQGLQANLSGY